MEEKPVHVMLKLVGTEIDSFMELKEKSGARSNVDLIRRALAAYEWLLEQEELTTKDGVRVEMRLL